MKRALVSVGVSISLWAAVCAPTCAAEPSEQAPEPTAAPAPMADESPSAPDSLTPPPDSGDSVADACKLFNAAQNVAAANYEDFAYATAGNGNIVNYSDPDVLRTNGIGRTALRQAAAAALSASRTPGLPPEVSDPMQSWSVHATKLLLVMGLHGGGDTLNNAVVELNNGGNEAQRACLVARS